MGQPSKTCGNRIPASASNALPGRKLATSRTPRMLQPSEVDLLRQDLQQAFSLLGQDEIDDAHAEIRSLGYDEGDFTFTRIPYTHIGTGVAPTIEDMVVMNTVNGKEKTYDAGHGSSWPVAFAEDLRTGYFGPPNDP